MVLRTWTVHFRVEDDRRVDCVFASACCLDLSLPCMKQEGYVVSVGTPLTLNFSTAHWEHNRAMQNKPEQDPCHNCIGSRTFQNPCHNGIGLVKLSLIWLISRWLEKVQQAGKRREKYLLGMCCLLVLRIRILSLVLFLEWMWAPTLQTFFCSSDINWISVNFWCIVFNSKRQQQWLIPDLIRRKTLSARCRCSRSICWLTCY